MPDEHYYARCSLDLRVCYTPCRFGHATNRKRCPYCEPRVTLAQMKEDGAPAPTLYLVPIDKD